MMRIVRDVRHCPQALKGAVVALGNFDGVHLGHREILTQCVATARSYGVAVAVMTFEPHPREFFSKQKEKLRLCSLRQKMALMENIGIDCMFLVRFNAAFASLSAEAFVDDVLMSELATKQVVTGYNFAFGKGRGGTTEYLAARAREAGFGYSACPPVHADGMTISSSSIRTMLGAGEVGKATQLLGHAYVIDGVVRHGKKLGATIGYPTANVSLARLFKPRYGVYAVLLTVEGDTYDAVASIGVRPTVGGGEPLLEVHAFDMDRDLYGKRISVEIRDFIRDEAKFDSVDAMKQEIARDCSKARSLLLEG